MIFKTWVDPDGEIAVQQRCDDGTVYAHYFGVDEAVRLLRDLPPLIGEAREAGRELLRARIDDARRALTDLEERIK